MLRVGGLLLVAGASLMAGPFMPPAEGPVAFRRDRVPLDAETMAGISRQLVTLAQGLEPHTAENRRAAAQMLALSMALDPGNAEARELLADFRNDSHRPTADAEPLEVARSRIWGFLGWLETPEAGAQGQALAACLTDVIVISDPQHPRVAALRAAGERGAWKGWIPGLAAYETLPEVVTPAALAVEAAPAKSGILLADARVSTPLWKRSARTDPLKWILAPAPLEMSAKMVPAGDGKLKPFSLVIGSQEISNIVLAPLIPPLLKLLENQHGSLPAGGRVAIFSPALGESLLSRKMHLISAATAVLASSAITGREPEATILGLIDESGAFKLPPGFWDQLQSLGAGNGGRLVLPAAAAEYLAAMLALERPQVFFDYEIVLATNFKELLELTAKTPDGSAAKVSAQFREIREKAGAQPLGQYVANPFIRRRLAEIVQDAPYHASAKMLALQGAGNRPVVVSRAVLAAELRRAIKPLDWLVKLPVGSFEGKQIDQLATTSETCHDQIERLFRYAEKNDREWVKRVQDMMTTIRVLDRTAKGRGESYEVKYAVSLAHTAFLRAYAEVAGPLAREAGDLAGEAGEAEVVPER